MKKEIITAIEITGTHIKLLQKDDSNRVAAISFGGIKNIAQLSDTEISQVLSKLVKESLGVSKRIIAAIPRRNITLAHLQLPSNADHEIRRMVDLQVVNSVPYVREDILYDYGVLEKNESGYTRVLVAIVQREIIQRYLDIFQKANIYPTILTLSSSGLLQWQIYQKNHKPQTQQPFPQVGTSSKQLAGRVNDSVNLNPLNIKSTPEVMIDVDMETSELCFCYEDKLLFSREIHFGSRHLNSQTVNSFVAQISLTLATYRRENMGGEISKIVVSTTSKDSALLMDRLKQEYQIPVVSISLTEYFFFSKRVSGTIPLESDGISLAAVVGFLFTSVPGFLNFLPQQVSSNRYLKQRKKQWIQSGILGLIVLILISAIFLIKISTNKRSLDFFQNKIKHMKPEVQQAQKKLQRFRFMCNELQNRISLVDFFHELNRLTPEGITFTGLDYDVSGKFTLQGQAKEAGDVNRLQEGLVASALFKNVTLEYATKRKTNPEEMTVFKFSCQIPVKSSSLTDESSDEDSHLPLKTLKNKPTK